MNEIIEYMIKEDTGFGDITSDILIPKDKKAIAKVISKDEGIVAGVEIAKDVFEKYGLEIAKFKEDGDEIAIGDSILEVHGLAKEILILERTVLNLIMRMSGVATTTSEIVEKVKNSKVRIAGTRKTSPALQKFDKMAIAIGGGDTHRFRLDDLILIKDNHISVVGSVSKAIELAKSKASFTKKIEVEVEISDDAIIACKSGADIVMLDNMSPDEIKDTIAILDKNNLRDKVLIEVSGGITKDNILDYADLGVDIISLGFLTHSVNSLDISLDIVEI